MVAVQTPEDFLSGHNCAFTALKDVEFRIGAKNSLQIKTPRLAKILENNDTIQSIENDEGWWESGDSAKLILNNQKQDIKILGRIDDAISSGGEIVFAEQINSRLINIAMNNQIPIETILLIPIKVEEWGERLVALVKLKAPIEKESEKTSILKLQHIVNPWPPYERPIAWYNCPELCKNSLGKWEMPRWKSWLKLNTTNSLINGRCFEPSVNSFR